MAWAELKIQKWVQISCSRQAKAAASFLLAWILDPHTTIATTVLHPHHTLTKWEAERSESTWGYRVPKVTGTDPISLSPCLLSDHRKVHQAPRRPHPPAIPEGKAAGSGRIEGRQASAAESRQGSLSVVKR